MGFKAPVLSTFAVHNFRTFSRLEVEGLGRVNLVVGRNNVGKSFLLEAMQVFAARGDLAVLAEQLAARDEVEQLRAREALGEGAVRRPQLESLFHGRSLEAGEAGAIRLSSGSDHLVAQVVAHEGGARLLVRGVAGGRSFEQLASLDSWWVKGAPALGRSRPPAAVLLPPRGLPDDAVGRWWDALVLAGLEELVSELFRLIEPVERIALVERPGGRTRMPVVRLIDDPRPIPLASLGDGMSRLFHLALALAQAGAACRAPQQVLFPEAVERPRLVLIDEIENGLHYSVLSRLWEFVFGAAARLGFQVVATTHSWDCVEAFAEAAREHSAGDSALVRLVRQGDRIESVTLHRDELLVVERDRIEVR